MEKNGRALRPIVCAFIWSRTSLTGVSAVAFTKAGRVCTHIVKAVLAATPFRPFQMVEKLAARSAFHEASVRPNRAVNRTLSAYR